MTRKKIKGHTYGYCRICGSKGKLSNDHVPPRGCGNKLPVVVSHGEVSRVSQNGVKFKSVCESCNSALGHKYDPELNKVFQSGRIALSERVVLPGNKVTLDVNPALLLRTITGHLLASNESRKVTEPPNAGSYNTQLRKFVQDPDFEPPDIDFYYWFYPYEEIRIIQYMGVAPDVFKWGGTFVYGAIFKFFPLGIWMVDRTASELSPRIDKIPANKNFYRLVFHKDGKPNADWPEMPTSKGVCLLNSDSFVQAKRK